MESEFEKIEKQDIKKFKWNWQVFTIIAVAVIFLAFALYLDNKNNNESPQGPSNPDGEMLKPVPPSQNPERQNELDPELGYGCAGPPVIEPEITKEPDKEWILKKDGTINTVSLGKYRITNNSRIVLDIKKLWLYFFNEELSSREDDLFALQKSYVSGIRLIVNGYERELKLGGSEYMFIELADYPLGDLYPYTKDVIIEFEFLIDLQCNNLENGKCLDNQDEELSYIDGSEFISRIRIFAFGCEEFTNDLQTKSTFKYGE